MAVTYYVRCINDDDPESISEEWVSLEDMPGLLIANKTTAARNSLPLKKGCAITNSDTGKLNYCDGSSWKVVQDEVV